MDNYDYTSSLYLQELKDNLNKLKSTGKKQLTYDIESFKKNHPKFTHEIVIGSIIHEFSSERNKISDLLIEFKSFFSDDDQFIEVTEQMLNEMDRILKTLNEMVNF